MIQSTVNAHSVVVQGDRRVVMIPLQSKFTAPMTVTTTTSARLVKVVILFKTRHYVYCFLDIIAIIEMYQLPNNTHKSTLVCYSVRYRTFIEVLYSPQFS